MTEPSKTSTVHPPKENVKETIISVIIAFAMAFVFRSFVAEAFIIPTGSMGPTLHGAHMRFTSPTTGVDWAVSPWYFRERNTQFPYSNQSEAHRLEGERSRQNWGSTIVVHDPHTGVEVFDKEARSRAGDRIFVLKYLYGISSPEPYDVVVFKNPTQPDENYIKRLIGLPGEQIAIVDGDVFVRRAPDVAQAPSPADASTNAWAQSGWLIRRKSAAAQRAVWQPVFDSSVMSGEAIKAGAISPWVATGATADAAQRSYAISGSGEASIAWDPTRGFVTRSNNPNAGQADRTREINDRYAYNEAPGDYANRPHFPVSDLRLRTTVVAADSAIPTLTGVIEARGHRFRAVIGGGKATLTMQAIGSGDGGAAEVQLAQGDAPLFSPGTPVRVEFWHTDQTLQLWINEELIVSKGYDWSPMERLMRSLTPEAWAQFNGSAPSRSANILADAAAYNRSSVRWDVSGGAATLHGVALDRDLYYRAATHGPDRRKLAGTPGAGTHPSSTITLAEDQFFVCGDNSPQSLDGRLWGYPDPWVAQEIDPSPSIVARRLMMGKAFFVYFPAPVGGSPVAVPDFGRLRFIR